MDIRETGYPYFSERKQIKKIFSSIKQCMDIWSNFIKYSIESNPTENKRLKLYTINTLSQIFLIKIYKNNL